MTEEKKSSFIVFVLYDSIFNSVFEGQVLQPLLHKAQQKKSKILLISFEKKTPSTEIFKSIKTHKSIELVALKKNFFLGLLSLNRNIRSLHKILKNLPQFKMYARGPHAGWISLHASKNTRCTSITIQARGILSEEYAFVHRHKKKPIAWIHALRKKHFETLEKLTYSHQNLSIPLTIEAVSHALKDYLIKQYKTPSATISIATNDIPKIIEPQQLQTWRTATRTKLGISLNTHVFCYNGSAKPWQCPEQIIQFFVEQQKKKNNCFLLILSKDKEQFQNFIKKQLIDPSHYYICSISHTEIFQFLAACDTGLLFREKNIINWVSRPTKLLEYKAANLAIEHNNTIAMLAENKDENKKIISKAVTLQP